MSFKQQQVIDEITRNPLPNVPIPISKGLSKRKGEEIIDEMAITNKDRTSLPNWLMPILFTVLFAFLTFVYATIANNIAMLKEGYEKGIDRLERRLETQETFMKNTREMLIRYGWDISDSGVITKRLEKK